MQTLGDIWASIGRLPIWVVVWVAVFLLPVNVASVMYWAEPYGGLVFILAAGGLIPNGFLLVWQRGVSKAMGFSHIILWTPLVVVIVWIFLTANLSPEFTRYLWILLVVNVISLAFDYNDAAAWLRGERWIV
jgi:hypothetical protein